MGRLEKIVVVTVLFLVAVILGISLNSDAPENQRNPIHAGRNPRRVETVADPAQADAQGAQKPTAPDGLMSTALPDGKSSEAASNPLTPAPMNNTAAANSAVDQRASAPVSNAPASAMQLQNPAASTPPAAPQYVVTKEGLEATPSDDFMLYTWKSGDSFKALAQKYYGSPLHVARLRAANEGRDEAKLVAGDKVLVSVAPTAAVDHLARSTPKEASADAKWTGGLYTVKQGDVLGTISSAVYGTAKNWKKIYDANRDVIGDDPNRLKVGSKLRIPE